MERCHKVLEENYRGKWENLEMGVKIIGKDLAQRREDYQMKGYTV